MKWLADENFRSAILRGVLRRTAWFDVVRAQDVAAVAGADDVAILRWATAEGRVVLTHDVSTMIPAIRQQIQIASECTPVVLVPDSLAVNAAIDDILLLDACATDADWAAGILYLPLR